MFCDIRLSVDSYYLSINYAFCIHNACLVYYALMPIQASGHINLIKD